MGDARQLPALRTGPRLPAGYATGVFSSRKIAAKLQTDEGKDAYRKRKWIAEPPNGWIKHILGFRQFSLRGLHRADAEWKLVLTRQ